MEDKVKKRTLAGAAQMTANKQANTITYFIGTVLVCYTLRKFKHRKTNLQVFFTMLSHCVLVFDCVGL